jgi:hypothetical protein
VLASRQRQPDRGDSDSQWGHQNGEAKDHNRSDESRTEELNRLDLHGNVLHYSPSSDYGNPTIMQRCGRSRRHHPNEACTPIAAR